jgi:hypothetical protein
MDIKGVFMRKIDIKFIVVMVVLTNAPRLQAGLLHFLKPGKKVERRHSDVNLPDLLGEMIAAGNVPEFERLQQSKEFSDHYVYCAEKIAMFIDQKSVELMILLVKHVGSKEQLNTIVEKTIGYELDGLISTHHNFWLRQWALDQDLKFVSTKQVSSELSSVQNRPILEDVQGDSIRRLYSLDLATISPRMYPTNESPSESTSRGSS